MESDDTKRLFGRPRITTEQSLAILKICQPEIDEIKKLVERIEEKISENDEWLYTRGITCVLSEIFPLFKKVGAFVAAWQECGKASHPHFSLHSFSDHAELHRRDKLNMEDHHQCALAVMDTAAFAVFEARGFFEDRFLPVLRKWQKGSDEIG